MSSVAFEYVRMWRMAFVCLEVVTEAVGTLSVFCRCITEILLNHFYSACNLSQTNLTAMKLENGLLSRDCNGVVREELSLVKVDKSIWIRRTIEQDSLPPLAYSAASIDINNK
jgi:hypothetical protein